MIPAPLPPPPRHLSASLLHTFPYLASSTSLLPRSSPNRNNEDLLRHFCHLDHLPNALSLLLRMESAPSIPSYVCLLKACNRNRSLFHAKQVHAHISLHGIHLANSLGDCLVVTLARCGAIDDAVYLSQTLPCRTVISWTAIISAYVDSGYASKALRMYQLMLEDGIEPDCYTFVSLFKACGKVADLDLAKKLQSQAQAKGFFADVFLGNSLISMYGKLGLVHDAVNVFTEMHCRDLVSWNAMLSVYVEQGQGEKALRLYRQMQEEGDEPDSRSLMFALQACGILAEIHEASFEDQVEGFRTESALEMGQALHAQVKTKGLSSDVFVCNTLVSMYGKCGAIHEAENVLSALPHRDVVSWTAMLSAYVEQNQGSKGLLFYCKMHEGGIYPDKLTFMTALQACSILMDIQEAPLINRGSNKQISLEIAVALESDFVKSGYSLDLFTGNTLLSMYGKCGAIMDAERIFSVISSPDVVSWSVMLSAYAENGLGEKALQLYRGIQSEQVLLNDATYVSVLQACCNTGGLHVCQQLHFSLIAANFDQIPFVAATLIRTYGGCGSILDAQVLFDQLYDPDSVSWTSCCAVHAEAGNFSTVLHMFVNLVLAGIRPDEILFASSLAVFNHSGLVTEGLHFFISMTKDCKITPNITHYGILLDLLGRSGNLLMIRKMLKQIPVGTDLTILLGLLGACGRHRDLEFAEQIFDNALILEPEDATTYILMSNVYATIGLEEHHHRRHE